MGEKMYWIDQCTKEGRSRCQTEAAVLSLIQCVGDFPSSTSLVCCCWHTGPLPALFASYFIVLFWFYSIDFFICWRTFRLYTVYIKLDFRVYFPNTFLVFLWMVRKFMFRRADSSAW